MTETVGVTDGPMASGLERSATTDFGTDTGQTAQLIAQLLARTPGGRLNQDDIGEAIECVAELYTAAATLHLWKTGKIEFGWDKDESALVLCSTEFDTQNAGQTSRPIFEGKSL